MQIAISTLVTPRLKAGVGNYVVNLIQGLQKIDQENDYYLFTGRDTRHLFDLWSPRFHTISLPISHDPRWLMRPLYYLWQNSLIVRHLRQHQIDVLHLPNLLPLLVAFVPTVVNIHDLAEYHIAKYSPIRQAYRKLLPRLIARRASRVLAISEHAKREIVALTGIADERVDVTYLAASLPQPVEAAQATDRPALLREPYILYVGSDLPHKNLKRLIEAFDLLKQRDHIPHQLVLAGKQKDEGLAQSEVVRRLRHANDLLVTGYIPDSDLPALYQKATLFAFPSLYEGFGMPLLEAMNYGTPVVTSCVSSLPEVAGDAAVLVDPFRVEAIADGLWAVLSDDRLRQRLIARGKQRAGAFSWEQCARDTIRAYQKALSS